MQNDETALVASCSHWSAASVAQIAAPPEFSLITAVQPALSDIDLWDSWPLATADGRTADVAGGSLWFMLSAPAFPDPGQRHDQARIRVLLLKDGHWHDWGNAMPNGFSPGSREWAGSALLHDDGETITLFFTAAGRRDEPPSFEQRIFAAQATLRNDALSGWRDLDEIIKPDGARYVIAAEAEGKPGAIKAFRDPAYFRDPADGRDYLLFTGSAGWSDHSHNGVVGLARREGERWVLDDPLIDAIGVNNELERPHIIVADGLYYLFWSTQRRTFAEDGPAGPNGLYAMVADDLHGPYRPVNRTGLIAANPASEPLQAYSWWVTGEHEVVAFVDHWGLGGRSFDDHPHMLRGQFGGTPAPRAKLRFDGDHVMLC